MSVDMMSGEIVIVIILSTPWFEFLTTALRDATLGD